MLPVALLWLIAALVLIGVEVVSGDLVLLMLGLGAAGAAGVSALGAPLGVDVAVFAASSLALILLARPALKRRLQAGHAELKTNVNALIGKKAIVESTVDSRDGRVRIDGQLWSARAFDETQVLEPGQTVLVMEISGATAVVWAEQ